MRLSGATRPAATGRPRGSTPAPETLVGNYADWKASDLIADLAFSPNFDVDNTIVALTVGDVVTTQNIGTYKGYWLQAGEWGNLKLWNAEGGYGSYPVLIKNGSDAIVAPLDPQLGSMWDIGELARRSGFVALPSDYMGDMSSGRRVMVAVNGLLMAPTTDLNYMPATRAMSSGRVASSSG